MYINIEHSISLKLGITLATLSVAGTRNVEKIKRLITLLIKYHECKGGHDKIHSSEYIVVVFQSDKCIP